MFCILDVFNVYNIHLSRWSKSKQNLKVKKKPAHNYQSIRAYIPGNHYQQKSKLYNELLNLNIWKQVFGNFMKGCPKGKISFTFDNDLKGYMLSCCSRFSLGLYMKT